MGGNRDCKFNILAAIGLPFINDRPENANIITFVEMDFPGKERFKWAMINLLRFFKPKFN